MSVVFPDPMIGFDFSTFPDSATIARAYGERATPKAAVTDWVKQLAAEIVGDRQAPAGLRGKPVLLVDAKAGEPPTVARARRGERTAQHQQTQAGR